MSRLRGAAALVHSRPLDDREGAAADGSGASGLIRSLRSHARRALSSVRTRIVGTFVILLLFATAMSVLAIRQVLLERLDQRIQATLEQEVDEFSKLAARGRDPETGEFFEGNSLEGLLTTYLSRNVPAEGEEVLVFNGSRFVDSVQSARSAVSPLESDAALVEHFGSLEQGEHGEVETPGGPARYIARPITFPDSDRAAGRFVVANFISGEREEVDEAVLIVAIVGACVLAFGSVLAFLAAGRVLKPVRDLDDTARSITETDLTRRIAAGGHDELAELSRTFNSMLDRLESAFDSQREFLRDAGHELRTPITIVRGHLELLGDDPVERRQTIELVTDELDRMSRFVADLSLLAKAQRPDFLRLETVDLHGFSDELLSKASALAPRDWQLEARAAGVVVADRQRLTEAVMNLAENAAAQTEAGDRIRLGTGVDACWAYLWVADEGAGIPAAHHESIFQRFNRGSASNRYTGSGLGLAIVRAIAESHRGGVALESKPGAGARFTIRFPVDQRHEDLAA